MNVLFVSYGSLASNSGVPLALHARGLAAAGHHCAVAVPRASDVEGEFPGRVACFDEALRQGGALFPDGRAADVVHAWTPRENVRRFATAWLARHPAVLVVYLEDNERCISLEALGADGADTLLRANASDLAALLPENLSHPFRFEAFVGLADAAVVIQDKLAGEVPPWVPWTTVMPGVDLALFAPRPAAPALRARHGLAEGERVIVYPGAVNPHTRAGIRALCEAVGLLNRQGQRCRLLRTGPFPLDFLPAMPRHVREAVVDIGMIPRSGLPELLALADVLVQPGQRDPFEDLRLPGKIPEFLAMGKPVVMPDANVAHLLADGENVLLTRTGSPEEIAARCAQVFGDPALAQRLGAGARRFAESAFDPAVQARRLLAVYEQALGAFDLAAARRLWAAATPDTPPSHLLAQRLRALGGCAAPDRLLPLQQELLQGAQRQLADGSADLPLLRAVLRERLQEVAQLPSLAAACAQVLAQVEQRLPAGVPAARPAQRTGRTVRQVAGLVQRLHQLLRHKGGFTGLLAAAWRVAHTEGWRGMRRRISAISTSVRLASARPPAERPAPPPAADDEEPARAPAPARREA